VGSWCQEQATAKLRLHFTSMADDGIGLLIFDCLTMCLSFITFAYFSKFFWFQSFVADFQFYLLIPRHLKESVYLNL
jgi:hypothetical protein